MDAAMMRTLYEYNYWVRDRVWECCDPLTEEQFTRDLGYSWGSIHDLWVHMMSAEWIWFSRFQGTSPTHMLDAADYPTRASIREAWAKIEADAQAYLARLRDEDLGQELVYRHTSGKETHNPLWISLIHVLNHGTDHRAQVLTMVHQFGQPTIEQDLIFFIRQRQ